MPFWRKVPKFSNLIIVCRRSSIILRTHTGRPSRALCYVLAYHGSDPNTNRDDAPKTIDRARNDDRVETATNGSISKV